MMGSCCLAGSSQDVAIEFGRHCFLRSHGRGAGSHSGVKLCRWTKSMLRGRGGCYKHAFYGIESHRCMEATPSLACANKCVFCWRHHTNPGLLPDCSSSTRLHTRSGAHREWPELAERNGVSVRACIIGQTS